MQRNITLNMGMRMPGWFDLYSLDKINDREDKEGLRESMRYGLNAEMLKVTALLKLTGTLRLTHLASTD